MQNANKAMSHEDFSRAWKSSKSVKEVEEKTGLLFKEASNRAAALRKRGVELKKFSNRQKIDVAGINAMLKAMDEEVA